MASTPGDNQAVLELAREYPQVRPALGFYPVDTVLNEMLAAGVDYPREGPTYSADEGVTRARARGRSHRRG